MNNNHFKWVLYTIIAVIITTIGIQVYWNYKNYQTNRQQLIRDVQISLDKAVDDYYTNLAERTTLGIFLKGDQQKNAFKDESVLKKFLNNIDKSKTDFNSLNTIDLNNIEGVTIVKGLKADSLESEINRENTIISKELFGQKVDSLKTKNDGLDPKEMGLLTSKVMISFKNDALDLKMIDSLITSEFERKNITVNHVLYYDKGEPHRLFLSDSLIPLNDSVVTKDDILSTTSKSAFLPKGSTLQLHFSNETRTIIKRIYGGILISALLIFAVISCLFYLLKIIKHQKQLAEVKNDLISNITHEFKTPIATIGVALESMSDFNAIDDKAKTKKYINMSSEQLGKLNVMVEKLLETATLDSDNLELKKESIDIIVILSALINHYRIQFPEKQFETIFKFESLMIEADPFHIENAFNNILDNAVKYGGMIISIDVIPHSKTIDILISDNGNALTQANKDRIFEKFYRIPKGNTHNVKGFGIGLYYTKTIIDKHNGSISLELDHTLTTFKITLPNGR